MPDAAEIAKDRPDGVQSEAPARAWGLGSAVWVIAFLGMLVFGVRLAVWSGFTPAGFGSAGTYIYDDVPIAREDPRLTDPRLWGTFWTRDFHYDPRVDDGGVDNLYRPLVSNSIALQVVAHGHRPVLLHLVNLMIYGGVCGLVAFLLQRVGGAVAGWVGGAWFAVHPIHSEVVCSIVGRAELLSALGIVGALTLFVGGRLTAMRVWGILACSGVALLSKEQAMLLPALLLAAEPMRRAQGRGVDGKSLQWLVAGVCLLVGGYIVLREQVLGLKFWWDRSFLDPAVQPMVWSVGVDRVLMPLALLGRAMGQLLFPADLSLDYSGRAIGWTVSLSDWRLWLGAATALAGVAGLGWAVWKRQWGAVFALVGFGLMWGVVSNTVSLIGVNYAERLLFLPSVFAALLVGLAASRWKMAAAVIAVWCVGMGVWAAVYSVQWGEREAFYRYSLARQPQSIRLHQLLADELMKRGALEEAAEVAERGTKVMPEYFAIWTQAGLIAEKRERWDEAERMYEQAAKADVRLGSGALMDFRARRAR